MGSRERARRPGAVSCKTGEVLIRNWQETEWGDGMMEPMSGVATPDRGLN